MSEQARVDLEKRVESNQNYSDLAQKMLAKTQGDLENLRGRYEKKVLAERELLQLINELKQKLTLASHYYFRLQEEHPELLSAPRRND